MEVIIENLERRQPEIRIWWRNQNLVAEEVGGRRVEGINIVINLAIEIKDL